MSCNLFIMTLKTFCVKRLAVFLIYSPLAGENQLFNIWKRPSRPECYSYDGHHALNAIHMIFQFFVLHSWANYYISFGRPRSTKGSGRDFQMCCQRCPNSNLDVEKRIEPYPFCKYFFLQNIISTTYWCSYLHLHCNKSAQFFRKQRLPQRHRWVGWQGHLLFTKAIRLYCAINLLNPVFVSWEKETLSNTYIWQSTDQLENNLHILLTRKWSGTKLIIQFAFPDNINFQI